MNSELLVIPEKPNGVDQNIWDSIFPPDRGSVLKRAASLYKKGLQKDQAFLSAIREEDKFHLEQVLGFTCSHFLDELSTLRGDVNAPRDLAEEYAIRIMESVFITGFQEFNSIISAEDPKRTAWKQKKWTLSADVCACCFGRLGNSVLRKFGDIVIHDACTSGFRKVAEYLSDLMVAQAKKRQDWLNSRPAPTAFVPDTDELEREPETEHGIEKLSKEPDIEKTETEASIENSNIDIPSESYPEEQKLASFKNPTVPKRTLKKGNFLSSF